jgi:hypothetical protein
MQEPRRNRTPMYCWQCGYNLFGLSESRCPECGRAFDPANRGSYRRYPPMTWLHRTALVVLAIVAVPVCAILNQGGLLVIVFVAVYWWQRARRRRLDAEALEADDREDV